MQLTFKTNIVNDKKKKDTSYHVAQSQWKNSGNV